MKSYISFFSAMFLGIIPLFSQSPSSISPDVPSDLTPQQLTGVLTVSGKAGDGTAFFCRINNKVFVLTNQHVLAGNSDAKFKTQAGVVLPMKSMHVADSADLALLEPMSIPNDITPFELLEQPELNARKDDAILIPGNSKGDGVVTQTPGKLITIGPQRIETDNPVYLGNSGSPIVHLASGKVIAVLTEAELISLNKFEAASFRNR